MTDQFFSNSILENSLIQFSNDGKKIVPRGCLKISDLLKTQKGHKKLSCTHS